MTAAPGAATSGRSARTLGELLRPVPLLPAATSCAAVAERFSANAELSAFVVHLGEDGFALVDRAVFLPQFLQRFNREVFSRQPIVTLAAHDPLVLPDDTTVEHAGTLITTRYPEVLKSSFIVTSRGDFAGIVLGAELMRAVALAAEEASVAKSTFLANMSHEIRTPLHAVIGTLELLGGTALETEQAALVRTAKVSAQALLDIIGDLLDLSKIQADRFELEWTGTDVRSVVADACAIVAPRAAEKGLRLLQRVADEVPALISSDPTRLRQVLVNFLSNAVKFTASGGVFVTARRLAEPPGAWLRLEVVDTGCGFDPARAAALFEPFVQEDVSTTRRFGGTGLGLAISRRIVDLLGGRIGCSSEPGLGASFWCELPLAAAEVDADAAVPPVPLGGARVVLAGTPGAARTALAAALLDQGAAVETLRGEELAQRAAGLAAAQLLVLVQAAEQERALEWIAAAGRAAPATVLGVGTSAAFRHRAHRAGAAEVLEHPRQAHELAQILRPPEEPAAAPDASAGGAAAGSPWRGLPPVLVIDDTATNRELAARQLQRLGLACDSAEHGLEGLQLATARRYCLILVDGSMPVMDGFEFARRLRSHEAGAGAARVPVVAMTANALAGAAERFLAAGMDDYLAKPVTLAKLRQVLERWLPPAAAAEPAAGGAEPAPAAAAAVDRAALAGMLGDDDPASLSGLLQVFVDDFAPLLEVAQAAFEAGDRAALKRAAHAAKGAAASAAAGPLAAVMARLEAQAAGAETAALERWLQAARGEFARVRAELAPAA